MLKDFVIICFGATLLLTSCKCGTTNNGSNDRTATSETTNAKDTLNKMNNNTLSTSDGIGNAKETTANSTNNKVNYNNNTTDKSFYKNGQKYSKTGSNTQGFFPEGSDRLLVARDLEYLSDWGIAIITNEIYARHGMIFNDEMLDKYFKEQKWYHPYSHSVGKKLTKIEKENLQFIKNHKTKPGSPD